MYRPWWSLFTFQIGSSRPLFQSGGMVHSCHLTEMIECIQLIMTLTPALKFSTLMLQILILATVSLTSSRGGRFLSTGGWPFVIYNQATVCYPPGGSTFCNCFKYSAQPTHQSSFQDWALIASIPHALMNFFLAFIFPETKWVNFAIISHLLASKIIPWLSRFHHWHQ